MCCQRYDPVASRPGNDPGIHWVGDRVNPEPWTLKPVTSRFTDCAVLTPTWPFAPTFAPSDNVSGVSRPEPALLGLNLQWVARDSWMLDTLGSDPGGSLNSCIYKVVQIWPGQTVTCLHTNSPGHIWTTLYLYLFIWALLPVSGALYLHFNCLCLKLTANFL